MSCLESLPEEYHSLPFHDYFAMTIPIAALNKEAEAILWHQRLIHCGSHSLKSASLYVDGVPNLSAFNFDDILKCPTCLKVNLTKNFGEKSLSDSVERPVCLLIFLSLVKSNGIRKVLSSKPAEKM